jgi:hypothetical protein
MKNIIIIFFIGILAACDSSIRPSAIVNNACNLDLIDNIQKNSQTYYVATKADLGEFNGWLIDFQAQKAPQSITIAAINRGGKVILIGNEIPDIKRDDVANAFKNQNFLNSGFKIKKKFSSLEPGVYSLVLNGVFDHHTTVCQIPVTLEIK